MYVCMYMCVYIYVSLSLSLSLSLLLESLPYWSLKASGSILSFHMLFLIAVASASESAPHVRSASQRPLTEEIILKIFGSRDSARNPGRIARSKWYKNQ